MSLDAGNKCFWKRISGGKRKGEKLAAGSNSSEQGILSGWVCRPLEKNFSGEDGFIIPKLGSLVGEIIFFFWINVTKHHKITMHCTFIHEPFLSFSANENISLHWNMNDNLKLVSWIAHLQPFSLNLTFLLNLKAVREKFYCFDADILPSLHAWSHCCYHLGILHVQEGKNIIVESPKLIWLSVC